MSEARLSQPGMPRPDMRQLIRSGQPEANRPFPSIPFQRSDIATRREQPEVPNPHIQPVPEQPVRINTEEERAKEIRHDIRMEGEKGQEGQSLLKSFVEETVERQELFQALQHEIIQRAEPDVDEYMQIAKPNNKGWQGRTIRSSIFVLAGGLVGEFLPAVNPIFTGIKAFAPITPSIAIISGGFIKGDQRKQEQKQEALAKIVEPISEQIYTRFEHFSQEHKEMSQTDQLRLFTEELFQERNQAKMRQIMKAKPGISVEEAMKSIQREENALLENKKKLDGSKSQLANLIGTAAWIPYSLFGLAPVKAAVLFVLTTLGLPLSLQAVGLAVATAGIFLGAREIIRMPGRILRMRKRKNIQEKFKRLLEKEKDNKNS